MLGDWAAVCLDCGSAQRWFEEFESELPEHCPACRGVMLHRCPACNAPFTSVFAVDANHQGPPPGMRRWHGSGAPGGPPPYGGPPGP